MANVVFFSILSLFPLFCLGINVTSTANGTLGTYEKELEMEGFRYWKNSQNESWPVTLKFAVDREISAASVAWRLNNQSLSPGNKDKGDNIYMDLVTRSQTTEINLHLINKAVVPGEYTVIVSVPDSVAEATGVVTAAPILPEFSKIKRVLEKDSVTLSCEFTGYPKPTEVSWKFVAIATDKTNGNLDSSPSVPRVLPNSVKTVNDTLKFDQIQVTDNGLYVCETKNGAGNDTTVIFVNVKGQWDALWPFIGIVIEVAVLVTAILLYERHQMRSKPTKQDTVENSSAPIKSASISAQQQQNNLVTQVTMADGNATDTVVDSTAERDGKTTAEELRMRSSTKC